jgi:TonB C terminal
VFELQRKEEEDSGHRSILGLSGTDFQAVPRLSPASPALLDETGKGKQPVEDLSRGSILGLERVEHSPEWKAAVAANLARDSAARGRPTVEPEPEPLAPDENHDRSILGLDRIEFSPEWRAAVAASPLRQNLRSKPAVRDRFLPAEGEEDEAGHERLLGLERSEFAVGRRGTSLASQPHPAVKASLPAPRSAPASDRRVERSSPAPREGKPVQIEVPAFERDLLERSEQPIPVERAILLSLVAHVLLLLLMLWMPFGLPSHKGGLLAGLIPEPKPEENKIPIVFRSSPGPERENTKQADLSDKSRRAGGGDRSRPRSDTPFVPRRPGIEGLAPGAGRRAAAPARPPQQVSKGSEKKPADTASEKAPQSSEEAFRVPPPGAGSSSAGEHKIADLQGAIRDAARAQVAGEEGAGFPNPEGGFVDTGPVSFETSWYDWGEYVAAMLRRLKLHWPPVRDPFKGWVTFRWAILPDGRVEDIQKVDTSGNPAYDYMALQAITGSNPFRPLPKDLLDQVGHDHREHVTVTFIYNYTIPEFEQMMRVRR